MSRFRWVVLLFPILLLFGCKIGQAPQKVTQKIKVADNELISDLNSMDQVQFLAKYNVPGTEIVINARYGKTEGEGRYVRMSPYVLDRPGYPMSIKYEFDSSEISYLTQFQEGDQMTFSCKKIEIIGGKWAFGRSCKGMPTETSETAQAQESKIEMPKNLNGGPMGFTLGDFLTSYQYHVQHTLSETSPWLAKDFEKKGSSMYCNSQYLCFTVDLDQNGSAVAVKLFQAKEANTGATMTHDLAVLMSVYGLRNVRNIPYIELAVLPIYANQHINQPFIYRGLMIINDQGFFSISLPAQGVNAKDISKSLKSEVRKLIGGYPDKGRIFNASTPNINSDNGAERNSTDAGSLDGDYRTDRHSIIISKNPDGTFHYKAWKSPKGFGEGNPDLDVGGGVFGEIDNGCNSEGILFRKGNLRLVINKTSSCSANAPSGADAELTIIINGSRKDHYWMYKT